MKFIKKNRYTLILLLVFALLFCCAITFKKLFIADGDKDKYYGRIDSKTDVEIKQSVLDGICKDLEGKEEVTLCTGRRQGKVINFVITVKDEVTSENAKKLSDEVIKQFSDTEISYFTLQYFVKKNNEKLNNFPIIGAHSPNIKETVWTKDREISEAN